MEIGPSDEIVQTKVKCRSRCWDEKYPLLFKGCPQKHLDEISKNISDIKDEINSLEDALACKDISKVYIVKSDIEKYRKLPPKILPSLPKYIPGKILVGELCTLFGSLSSSSLTSDEHCYSLSISQRSVEAGSSPPVKQLLDEPETVTIINTNYGFYGEKQTIQFVDEEKPLYSTSSVNQRHITENRNLDICVSDDKANQDGQFLCYIDCGQCYTWGLCTDTNDNLFVAQWVENQAQVPSDNGAKAVVLVNQAGKLKFGYTGHIHTPKNKQFTPKGITTDSQSHILIADFKNGCVHIIDQEGRFLCFIDCGLMKPIGLCVDSNDNMFVAQ
ncbi:uncharacterized protein LOC134272539, partial [Saccostrea cucullata]|uniref:uncharacterized protein LOC134272539 n=1 Tax=Saccostrea cuccullata TaxID=36930 RepID=UPI002ED4A327